MVRVATAARLRAVPDARGGPVPARLRCAPRRRRHGCARAERRARDHHGYATSGEAMGGMKSAATRRLTVLVTLLTLGMSVLGACTVTGTVIEDRVDEHRFDQGIGQAPEVVVETFNGRISVNAGEDGAVDVRVTSRGSGSSQDAAEADLAKVGVTFDQEGVEVTITARRTDRPAAVGNSGAHVEVTVPRGSSLELRTSNGRIEAANITGS